MRPRLSLLAGLGFLLAATLPAAAQDETALINQGRYIAVAADCAACHARPGGGSAFGGGAGIGSPLGTIYASNITPDPVHGIGTWSLQQFGDALRKGRSPDKGWLYPAMPYPAYAGMSDQDVRALYEYLTKAVPASPNQPPQTRLPFPFLRPAMIGWDLLFLHAQPGQGADAPPGSAARGAYVAAALAHCSTCHTPRNAVFAEDAGKLLAGADLGGWVAPNITPDATGIGGWSDAELRGFLTTGHNAQAVAGGDMGLAVQRSLSRLSPDDMTALIAYLHTVPKQATAARTPASVPAPLDLAAAEPQQGDDLQKNIADTGTDGAVLYQSTCAACHGADGAGSADGQHPNLALNDTVRAALPNDLVAVIAYGVHRQAAGASYAMPGFGDALDNAQIAALTSYVRQHFAGRADGAVTTQQVADIRAGRVPVSWIIKNAAWLAILGVAVAGLVLLLLLLLLRAVAMRLFRAA